jgi:hypothetical protein
MAQAQMPFLGGGERGVLLKRNGREGQGGWTFPPPPVPEPGRPRTINIKPLAPQGPWWAYGGRASNFMAAKCRNCLLLLEISQSENAGE